MTAPPAKRLCLADILILGTAATWLAGLHDSQDTKAIANTPCMQLQAPPDGVVGAGESRAPQHPTHRAK